MHNNVQNLVRNLNAQWYHKVYTLDADPVKQTKNVISVRKKSKLKKDKAKLIQRLHEIEKDGSFQIFNIFIELKRLISCTPIHKN